MTNIAPTFPVFVLCCALFSKIRYTQHDEPLFNGIKFRYFSHDSVVFHSHTIRKRLGLFKILADPNVRTSFYSDVGSFFQNSSCTLIAAGIDKLAHFRQYVQPFSPYDIALLFCLERLYAHLRYLGSGAYRTICVFESRGHKEDTYLELLFRRICSGANQWNSPFAFEPIFATKTMNLTGLQVADLAAYPIARYIINPQQANPAYTAVQGRFRRSPQGHPSGWGLKVFP